MSERFNPEGKISPESINYIEGLSKSMEGAVSEYEEIDEAIDSNLGALDRLEEQYADANPETKKQLLESISEVLKNDPDNTLPERPVYESFISKHKGEL